MRNSPIVIVEDDKDDCEFILIALQEAGIKNEVRCFQLASKALEYLKTTEEQTFLILSDINMPVINGLEFKQYINEDDQLSKKNIPFVFLSTTKNTKAVEQAFKLCAHGYFQKPSDMKTFHQLVKVIMDYWKDSSFNDRMPSHNFLN